MEILKVSSAQKFIAYADDCLQGHEGAVIHSGQGICIWTGQLPTYDKEKVRELNLEVGIGKYLGGTIVCFPDDVSVCLTTWGTSDLVLDIMDKSVQYFQMNNLNISTSDNDVLVDGKKVLSWARATTIDGWCQSVIHYSIGEIDMELIDEICTKTRVKVPGSLSEYGITSKEIINLINDCINSYKGGGC